MGLIYKDGVYYGDGGGSGSSGHEIQEAGTALPAEPALNFNDFDLDDNSADGSTDVAPHRLTSTELDDIVTRPPAVYRGNEYSESEQVVGHWIDGKPLYQKSLPITLTTAGQNEILHNIANVDFIMADFSASYVKVNTEIFTLTCVNQGSGTYINDVNLNWLSATKVAIVAGANRLGSGYITLRYTKTTD